MFSGSINRSIKAMERFEKKKEQYVPPKEGELNYYEEGDPRREIHKNLQTSVNLTTDLLKQTPEPVKEFAGDAAIAAGQIVKGLGEMNVEARKTSPSGFGPLDPLIGAGIVIDKATRGIAQGTGVPLPIVSIGEAFFPYSRTFSMLKKALPLKATKTVQTAKVLNTATDLRTPEKVFRLQQKLNPVGEVKSYDDFLMELGETAFLKKSPTGEIISKRQPNIFGEKVPLTKVDATSIEWFKIGGGLDTELNKLLTIGVGKNKKLITLAELENLAKIKPGMQARLDKYKSLIATPPPSSTGDVLIYGYENKLLARTAALNKYSDYIPAYHKSLEFHHASMKALEFSIHKKARELLQKGIITEADLVRLHNVGELKNIQSGSRRLAGIDMHRQTHNLLHKEIMLPKGIQPSHLPVGIKPISKPKNISSELWKQMKKISPDITKFDVEYVTAWGDKGISKWKNFRKTDSYKLISKDATSELNLLRNEIDNINNIEDLIQFRSDMIDNIVTPMTDEALLLERALEKLSTTEVLNLDKNITPLRKARKMQKAQEKAISTHKQQTIIEDAMKVAYE